jgi:hypothetical protein
MLPAAVAAEGLFGLTRGGNGAGLTEAPRFLGPVVGAAVRAVLPTPYVPLPTELAEVDTLAGDVDRFADHLVAIRSRTDWYRTPARIEAHRVEWLRVEDEEDEAPIRREAMAAGNVAENIEPLVARLGQLFDDLGARPVSDRLEVVTWYAAFLREFVAYRYLVRVARRWEFPLPRENKLHPLIHKLRGARVSDRLQIAMLRFTGEPRPEDTAAYLRLVRSWIDWLRQVRWRWEGLRKSLPGIPGNSDQGRRLSAELLVAEARLRGGLAACRFLVQVDAPAAEAAGLLAELAYVADAASPVGEEEAL